MRHRDSRVRLKQKPEHARMLKRNLLTSLLLYESVRTTQSRAKAIAPMVDRLIRNAKKQDPHNAIRGINKLVTDKNASRKVMQVLVKRYADRPSGLTRIVAAGARGGDGAKLVDISLVDSDIETPVEAPAKKAAPNKKEAAEKKEAPKVEKTEKKDDDTTSKK